MSSNRILLFGGTFDPIHHGHLIACQSIAERIDATRVILIPCATSPFKPPDQAAHAAHRLAMCRCAAAGDDLFEVSDIEIQRGGSSYTFDTVAQFRAEMDEADSLYWLIGADSLPQLHKWHRAAELVKLCQVVVAARPPMPTFDWSEIRSQFGERAADAIRDHTFPTPLIEISSTDLRTRAAANQTLRYRVPDQVADYIKEHNLYRED